jgi:hypothetical protein
VTGQVYHTPHGIVIDGNGAVVAGETCEQLAAAPYVHHKFNRLEVYFSLEQTEVRSYSTYL